MPPKKGIPFEEPVQSSNYHVIKGNIKKNKSVISFQLTTLNKEMMNLRRPQPQLCIESGITWPPLTTAEVQRAQQ